MIYLTWFITLSGPSNCWHVVLCAWAHSQWEVYGSPCSLWWGWQDNRWRYWPDLPPCVSSTPITNTDGMGLLGTGKVNCQKNNQTNKQKNSNKINRETYYTGKQSNFWGPFLIWLLHFLRIKNVSLLSLALM